jgi:hypothetical protein
MRDLYPQPQSLGMRGLRAVKDLRFTEPAYVTRCNYASTSTTPKTARMK